MSNFKALIVIQYAAVNHSFDNEGFSGCSLYVNSRMRNADPGLQFDSNHPLIYAAAERTASLGRFCSNDSDNQPCSLLLATSITFMVLSMIINNLWVEMYCCIIISHFLTCSICASPPVFPEIHVSWHVELAKGEAERRKENKVF